MFCHYDQHSSSLDPPFPEVLFDLHKDILALNVLIFILKISPGDMYGLMQTAYVDLIFKPSRKYSTTSKIILIFHLFEAPTT